MKRIWNFPWDQWVIKYIQKYLRQQNLLLELCNKNQTKSLIPAFN